MTIIDILNTINIPPLRDCGVELNKMERLKSYFHRLDIADFCTTNDEALNLINNVLVEVEDCHSGIAANGMPGLEYSGRMYPIQEDFIVRDNDRIIARSKGNEIVIDNAGDFVIKDRKTGLTIISKTRQN
jgi:hypothetical protein